MTNHYDVLCVDRAVSADAIKAAYRKMASRLHPDRNIGKDTTSAMQEINAAYAVLGDPDARKMYDFQFLLSNSLVQAAFDAAVASAFERRAQCKPAQEPTKAEDGDQFEPIQPKATKPRKTRTKPQASPQQEAQPMDTREELRAEVKRLCFPSAYIRERAGVMHVRRWKAEAAKWMRVATSEHASIEALVAARDAMLMAMKPEKV